MDLLFGSDNYKSLDAIVTRICPKLVVFIPKLKAEEVNLIIKRNYFINK
jgi:hypothetical protein